MSELTNAEQMRVSVWDAINSYAEACGGDHRVNGPRMDAVVAVERALQDMRTCAQADLSASLEAGVKGKDGCWPDWVYSARDAIQHRDKNIPWLNELLEALGWNGGNIHQALQCVKRLVAANTDPSEPSPLTDEEAQAAYNTAPSEPLSEERLKEIVNYATKENRP